MRYARTIEIAVPVGRVFSLLERPDRHAQWLGGLEETVYAAPFDPARPMGTRFTYRMRGGRRLVEFGGEITAFEKPRRLGLRIGNVAFAMDVEYRLTPADGRTRLDYSVEVTNTALATRISGVLMWPATRRLLTKQLKRLKEVAERRG